MTEVLLGMIFVLGAGFAIVVVLALQAIQGSLVRLATALNDRPTETKVPTATGDGQAQTGVQLAEDDILWSRYMPRPGEERR